MGILDRVIGLFSRGEKEQKKLALAVDMPNTRVSMPDDSTVYGSQSYTGKYSTLDAGFDLRILQTLEDFSVYNGDFSHAVGNIVSLGNTPFEIHISETVSQNQRQEMQAHLTDKMDSLYRQGAGITTLVSELLIQLAVTGAISIEWVPQTDLEGIDKVVKVSPATIRFARLETGDLEARQLVSNYYTSEAPGYVVLNPVTYRYKAIRTAMNNNPYAIPPLMAALGPLSTQDELVTSLKQFIQQNGAAGWLLALVGAPEIRDGEQPEAYEARVNEFVQNQVPKLQTSFANKVLVGLEGMHQFEVIPTNNNIEGAQKLLDMIGKLAASGLQQEPSMLGRDSGITETFGRVVLQKLTNQVETYQRAIASVLQELFKTELLLAGFPVQSVAISVEFASPAFGDRVKEQQAYAAKLNNATLLYRQGIIDQSEFARIAGYDKPHLEQPRAPIKIPGMPNVGDRTEPSEPGQGTDTDEGEPEEETERLISRIRRVEGPDYPYSNTAWEHDYKGLVLDVSNPVSVEEYAYNMGDPQLTKFVRRYIEGVGQKYTDAVDTFTDALIRTLESLSPGTPPDEIADAVYTELLRNWESEFVEKIKPVIRDEIDSIYSFYRQDKSIFGSRANAVPEPSLSLRDNRTMNHYKNADEVYLGRFITDSDTRNRITGWVKNEFLKNGRAVDATALREFKEQFPGVLNGESYKIGRVLATTTNKMKNYAAVSYMQQAEVKTFEIRGVKDRLQCDWCKRIQGYRFSVSSAVQSVDEELEKGPEAPLPPFLVNSVRKEELPNLTSGRMESIGITKPPYHPGCRDVIIAVFD